MTLSHSVVEVCDALKTYLIAGAVPLGIPFLQDGTTRTVYYGSTEIFGTFPAIEIANASKIRQEEEGSTHKWRIDLSVDIMIHYSKVQDSQTNERAENVFAEAVEDYVNLNPQLGGLIIFGRVERSENVINRRTMLRSRRLMWAGLSQQVF